MVFRDSRGSGDNFLSPPSDEFSGWTRPAAPTGLTVSGTTSNTVSFAAATLPSGVTHRVFYTYLGGPHPTGFNGTSFASPGRARKVSVYTPAEMATGVTFPKGSTFVIPGAQYTFYAVDYNSASTLQSAHGSVVAHTSPAIPPNLETDQDRTTHETLVFTDKVALVSDFTRRYFIAKQDLRDLEILADGRMHDGTHFGAYHATVTTRAANSVVYVGADPRISGNIQLTFSDPSALALEANTQYWLRAYDYRTGQPTAKTVLSTNQSLWTRPAVVTIVAPTSTNHDSAETAIVNPNTGTEIHWILVKESEMTDVTTTHIKNTNKGSAFSASRTVLKKGTVSAGSPEKITLHDDLHGSVKLAVGSAYTLYYAVESTKSASNLFANFNAPNTPQEVEGVEFTVTQGRPDTPAMYAVAPTEATHEEVKLESGPEIASGTTRHFFYSTDDLPLLTDRTKIDRAGREVKTFTIPGPQGSPHSFLLGKGNFKDSSDGELSPNTKYYIRARDTRGGDNSDMSDPALEAYTRPATVTIAVPTNTNHDSAETATVTPNTDTEIHWILVKESEMTDVTTTHIKNTNKGSAFLASRTVLKKGTVSAGSPEKITLHDDLHGSVKLAVGSAYTLYYAVESTKSASNLFANFNAPNTPQEVEGVEFTVTQGRPDTPAMYAVAPTEATHEEVKLESGPEIASGTTRHFFYSTDDLPLLTDRTKIDRAGREVKTFTIPGPQGSPHSFLLGKGNFKDSSDGELSPNTKYYIRARDTRGGDNSDMSDPVLEAYTRPAAVTIAAPTGGNLTPTTATTEIVSVALGTDVHWILVKGGTADTDGLTGDGIESVVIGTSQTVGMRSGLEVVNKDRLRSNRQIELHSGITLTPGTHVLYYVVKSTHSGSGLYSVVKGVAFNVPAPVVDPVVALTVPAYTVNTNAVTDTQIPLTKSSGADPSGTLIRRFFVNEGTRLDLDTTQKRDGIGLDDAVTNFTVNAPGAIVIGNTKGAGDTNGGMPIGGSNPALTANKKYFIYATDYDTTTGKVSLAGDVAGPGGTWTRPAAVTIAVPTNTNHDSAETETVTPNTDTEIHWILIKESGMTDVTTAHIKNTDKGLAISGSRTVLKKGTVSAGSPEKITLHDDLHGNAKLAVGSAYTLYYAVEGEGSNLFADLNSSTPGVQDVVGVTLNVTANPTGPDAPAAPVYTVNAAGATTTTIPLTKGGSTALASSALIRTFLVKEGSALSSEGRPTFSFTVASGGDVVIGNTKGAGTASPTSGSNPALTANEKYFIYVFDMRRVGASSKNGPRHSVTGADGAWTLPEALTIAAPAGGNLTATAATTNRVPVADDTAVHWVLLKESSVETAGLLGGSIKNATKGTNIVGNRRVLNKGTLSDSGAIALHDGITLTPGAHAFYYVVEGVTSAKFTSVKGVSFTVPDTPDAKRIYGSLSSPNLAYPNPTSGLLHVPVPSGVAVVYDSDGAEVGSLEVSAGQIDLSDLPAGMYVVRLSGHVFRVVKQHR